MDMSPHVTYLTIGPFIQWILGFVWAIILACIPVVVPALLKRWHIANNSDLAKTLDAALEAAAGDAYRLAVARTMNLSIEANQNAVAVLVAQSVVDKVPDILKALNITPEGVADRVASRLGKLMAADPTLTTGTTGNPVASGVPATGKVTSPSFTKG